MTKPIKPVPDEADIALKTLWLEAEDELADQIAKILLEPVFDYVKTEKIMGLYAARDAQKLAAVLEKRPEKIVVDKEWRAKNPQVSKEYDSQNLVIDQYDSVVRSVLGNNSKGDNV